VGSHPSPQHFVSRHRRVYDQYDMSYKGGL
jgi:hypothetical protein